MTLQKSGNLHLPKDTFELFNIFPNKKGLFFLPCSTTFCITSAAQVGVLSLVSLALGRRLSGQVGRP